jgi:hypothetical protein
MISNNIFMIYNKIYVISNKIYKISNKFYMISNKLYMIYNTIYMISNKFYMISNKFYMISNKIYVISSKIYKISKIAKPQIFIKYLIILISKTFEGVSDQIPKLLSLIICGMKRIIYNILYVISLEMLYIPLKWCSCDK